MCKMLTDASFAKLCEILRISPESQTHRPASQPAARPEQMRKHVQYKVTSQNINEHILEKNLTYVINANTNALIPVLW